MTENEIKKTIFSILKNIAPDTDPETLGLDDNIRRKLGIDSFDYLQFIIGLEDQLKIKIPEEDYGKIEKFSELVEYICNYKK